MGQILNKPLIYSTYIYIMDSLISGLYVVIYTVYGSLYHYIKYNEGYKPTHVSHFRAPP
jgi:hypothetical protein